MQQHTFGAFMDNRSCQVLHYNNQKSLGKLFHKTGAAAVTVPRRLLTTWEPYYYAGIALFTSRFYYVIGKHMEQSITCRKEGMGRPRW